MARILKPAPVVTVSIDKSLSKDCCMCSQRKQAQECPDGLMVEMKKNEEGWRESLVNLYPGGGRLCGSLQLLTAIHSFTLSSPSLAANIHVLAVFA